MDRKESKQERSYNIVDKMRGNRKCHQNFVMEMKGSDLKYGYLQELGFSSPLLFKDKSGLGMRVPGPNFTLNDFKRCIGSKKVVGVTTREGEKRLMTLKEFARQLEARREELFALDRFDFSGTKLETCVERPEVVQQMEWANILASSDLKGRPEGESGVCPALGRFCSLSLAGHYDDFTVAIPSQWIHLLQGKIVLWLVPASEESYNSYVRWRRSGDGAFFGDVATSSQRLKFEQGWTLLIPSGWIVAQYTMEDALVVGGMFLDGFSTTNQIAAYRMLRTLSSNDPDCMHFKEKLWQLLDANLAVTLGHSRRRQAPRDRGGRVEGRERVVSSSNEDTDVEEASAEPEPARVRSLESVTGPSSSSPTMQPCSSQASLEHPSTSLSASSKVIKVVTVKLENCMISQRSAKNEARFLSGSELDGLDRIADFLLAEGFSSLPHDLVDPEGMISDIKKVIQEFGASRSRSSSAGKRVASLVSRQEASVDPSARPFWPPWDHFGHPLDHSGLPSDQLGCLLDHQSQPPKAPQASSSAHDQLSPVIPQSVSIHTLSADGGASAGGGESWSNPGRESVLRRRRVRCKRCEPCTRGECGECHFCRDMKKFGGQGKMKQTCVNRQCLAPILSTSAVCGICGKGDHPAPQGTPHLQGFPHGEAPDDLTVAVPERSIDPVPNVVSRSMVGNRFYPQNELMECSVCWKITHPLCFKLRHPELASVEPVTNEDLPNSWDCPSCCEAGRSGQKKPRPSKASSIPAFSSSTVVLSLPKKEEFSSESEDEEDPREIKFVRKVRVDRLEQEAIRKRSWNDSIGVGVEEKRPKMVTTEGQSSKVDHNPPSSSTYPSLGRRRPAPQSLLCEGTCTQEKMTPLPLGPHAPKYVVRPVLTSPPPKCLPIGDGSSIHPMRMEHWLRVFGILNVRDLSACMLVCRTWNQWCYYTPLWRRMDMSRRKIRKVHLIAVAKHQPEELDLSHTDVTDQQLSWMVARLLRLRRLRLEGCSREAVLSLRSNGSHCCPLLTHLDVSWVSHLSDSRLGVLLSAATVPGEARPGATVTGCRLQNCLELNLAGTEVGDASLELLARTVTKLRLLDVSYCINVTCKGLDFLAASRHSPGRHQSQSQSQSHSGRQHQSKHSSPARTAATLSSDRPSSAAAAGHAHCGQANPPPSSSSASSPSPGAHPEQPSACLPQPSCVSPANPAHFLDPLMPLPSLRKLVLIGCHWIEASAVAEARRARPKTEVVHALEGGV